MLCLFMFSNMKTEGDLMSWRVIEVSEKDFRLLKEHNRPIEATHVEINGVKTKLNPNEGLELVSEIGNKLNVIFDSQVGIRKINDFNPQYSTSKNRDLALLNDLLTNPAVNTVIIDGFFGTGKTANVMAHVVEYLKTDKHPEVYMSKPHVPVGKTYGHLPGELEDKIHYEFRSYYQYIDRFWKKGMADQLIRLGELPNNSMARKEIGNITLEALPFEYLRGLDLEKGWVILDETQNTDIQEVATFISRLNDPVKAVVIGDMTSAQIDRKSVRNPDYNGFEFLKRTYEDKPYSGFVRLNTRNHILRGNRVRDLYDAISSIQN